MRLPSHHQKRPRAVVVEGHNLRHLTGLRVTRWGASAGQPPASRRRAPPSETTSTFSFRVSLDRVQRNRQENSHPPGFTVKWCDCSKSHQKSPCGRQPAAPRGLPTLKSILRVVLPVALRELSKDPARHRRCSAFSVHPHFLKAFMQNVL